MSLLDEAKARVTAGIMYVVNGSRENCLLKGLLSGVMGIGMGVGFGVFLGTFEGCHGEMLGSTMPDQLKYAMKQTVVCTYRRCVNYSATFGSLGVILAAGNCWLAKFRGKDDQVNSVISGAVAGAGWGGIAARRQPIRRIVSSATKCSIGFVVFGLVMDYVINSFQEQAAWTEHIKLPKTVI